MRDLQQQVPSFDDTNYTNSVQCYTASERGCLKSDNALKSSESALQDKSLQLQLAGSIELLTTYSNKVCK